MHPQPFKLLHFKNNLHYMLFSKMICDDLHLTYANIHSKLAQIIPTINQAARHKYSIWEG
jgi:hypothetical protein